MIRHHMSFYYLYTLILAKRSYYFLQVFSVLVIYYLSPVLGYYYYLIFA